MSRGNGALDFEYAISICRRIPIYDYPNGLSLDEKGHPEFVKAKVLEVVDSESIIDFAHATLEDGAYIASDGLSIYRKLVQKGYIHRRIHSTGRFMWNEVTSARSFCGPKRYQIHSVRSFPMIYVGIDVVKDKHDCLIISSDGEVLHERLRLCSCLM